MKVRSKSWWLGLAGLILLATAVFWLGTAKCQGPAEQEVEKPPVKIGIDRDAYDVIVIGGEPEGVAAAVASARNGAKTLLIEHRDGLGGLMTYGMLTHLDTARDHLGLPANQGIFAEWHEMVGGKPCFDVPAAKKAFLALVQKEKNLTLLLRARVTNVEVTEAGNKIEAVTVEGPFGQKRYTAQRFVDCTQDADVAAMAGVPYFVGKEDIGLQNENMCVTLMMFFKNVNWWDVCKTAVSQKFGPASFYSNAAWGFWKVSQAYQPHSPRARMRGLNLARQGDGTVSINALQIFGVNPLDETSKAEAIAIGQEETKHVLEFLRREFPGFENAEIAYFPPELYVRESRHIRCEYQLPISDVWENRDHWDSIGFGGYPVDLQATSPYGYNYVLVTPKQYAIPFRSLVPLKVDNLLVASRCSGYSSLAAGSARTLPTGMTTGQAAGTAAAISVKRGQDFRAMCRDQEAVKLVQDTLRQQGARLYPFQLSYPYQNEWFYPYLKILYSKGLVFAGYDNNIYPEKRVNADSFLYLLNAGVKRTNPAAYQRFTWPSALPPVPITRDQAAYLVLHLRPGSTVEKPQAWEEAYKAGLVPEELYKRVPKNRALNRAEVYALVGNFLERLEATDTH